MWYNFWQTWKGPKIHQGNVILSTIINLFNTSDSSDCPSNSVKLKNSRYCNQQTTSSQPSRRSKSRSHAAATQLSHSPHTAYTQPSHSRHTALTQPHITDTLSCSHNARQSLANTEQYSLTVRKPHILKLGHTVIHQSPFTRTHRDRATRGSPSCSNAITVHKVI